MEDADRMLKVLAAEMETSPMKPIEEAETEARKIKPDFELDAEEFALIAEKLNDLKHNGKLAIVPAGATAFDYLRKVGLFETPLEARCSPIWIETLSAQIAKTTIILGSGLYDRFARKVAQARAEDSGETPRFPPPIPEGSVEANPALCIAAAICFPEALVGRNKIILEKDPQGRELQIRWRHEDGRHQGAWLESQEPAATIRETQWGMAVKIMKIVKIIEV